VVELPLCWWAVFSSPTARAIYRERRARRKTSRGNPVRYDSSAMTGGAYVFQGTAREAELERLRALERAFDAGTRRWLLRTGVGPGWRCLEVGAGAGSIARWLSEVVGTVGQVVALDLDARFLSDINVAAPNLEIVEADIRTAHVAPGAFDLVHARFLLIHLADWAAALEAMIRCVKPGGWLVVEEPDFSSARVYAGDAQLRAAFENVGRAVEAMFARRGMDHAFGARIPALLQDLETARGFREICVENDLPVDRGGGPIATMMGMSTRQLRDKYVATGHAAPDDIERYDRLARDQTFWASYHGVIRGAARARS
jgi:SAM-dependent methyltransferase